MLLLPGCTDNGRNLGYYQVPNFKSFVCSRVPTRVELDQTWCPLVRHKHGIVSFCRHYVLVWVYLTSQVFGWRCVTIICKRQRHQVTFSRFCRDICLQVPYEQPSQSLNFAFRCQLLTLSVTLLVTLSVTIFNLRICPGGRDVAMNLVASFSNVKRCCVLSICSHHHSELFELLEVKHLKERWNWTLRLPRSQCLVT